MTNLSTLTITQLNEILALKEQIETLQTQLDSIAGGEVPTPIPQETPDRGRRSAAVRARMAAAQKARWANIKGTAGDDSKPEKKKRHISAAHRRKLIKALAKARKMRWAKTRGAAATS
jgi:hypothetical protein